MDGFLTYFTRLKIPGPDVVRHIRRFWLASRRVGNVGEVLSFIMREVTQRLYPYQVRNRSIRFTDHTCLSITSATADVLTSTFLTENGLCFRAVGIDWKFCLPTSDGLWWGSRYTHPNALYRSDDQSQSAVLMYEFSHPITSLFISRQNVLFVCSNGIVYKGDQPGIFFKPVLQLSSPMSYFLFNNGMTELPDGTLIIGEYSSDQQGQSWQNLAYLYYSTDGGRSWEISDFFIRQGVNKRIYLVKYSSLLKAVLLTDGDHKKQLWMNPALGDFKAKTGYQKTGWCLLTPYHHQTGGYRSMAETGEGVLLGSDYPGGTNFIVKTADGKRFEKLVLPDPYRRSPVINIMGRQSAGGPEIWAASYSCLSDQARSLLMCTQDGGKSWVRVIDVDGTKHEVRLVSSSPDLYIAVTELGSDGSNHQHRVYKLESINPHRQR
ncbi:hypothetical protein LX87_04582 [Larkinella arboricola]|uniref:BNR repeat protein n=1 Tax=Larkinella arboricola TaxID=643671 RepID=A0A327WVD2_LARAB|nr:sialidase family protein [Larkinella arboricola]RAJ93070.1 hypothetical protein LX87_04582 [Larkinella arboricola]